MLKCSAFCETANNRCIRYHGYRQVYRGVSEENRDFIQKFFPWAGEGEIYKYQLQKAK
jgi:hypothetical protein